MKILILFNHYKVYILSTKPQPLISQEKKNTTKSTNGNDFLLKIEFLATNFPIISLIGFFTFSHLTAGYYIFKEQQRLEPTIFIIAESMRQIICLLIFHMFPIRIFDVFG